MQLDKFVNRYESLKKHRDLYRSLWQDISEYMNPSSGFFDKDKGEKRKEIDYKKFIDSVPRQAVSVLASGMQSGITSPSRPWFNLGLSIGQRNLPYAIEVWLSTVKNLMEDVIASSNIYQALHQLYEETATYGTGCMVIDRDFNNVVKATTFTVGEYVLGKSASNTIDTFGREFEKTVGELVGEFGLENVSDTVRRKYEDGQIYDKIAVYHIICPNTERDVTKIDNRNMPFISVYWENGADKPLRVSGYQVFPVVCPRWRVKSSSDIYGIGIGQEVLGDVKMLQEMNKEKLIALSKITRPPLQVSNNVQGTVNLRPDGITRYSGTTDQAVAPVYKVQIDLQSVEFAIQQTENRINKSFFVDVFSMLQGITQEKTAREVEELHLEKLMMLGPIFEIFKMEVLDILINIVFQYCFDAGIVPPAPQEIEGQDIKVEYISMVAQAQKQAGVANTNQFMGMAFSFAQADPSVLDNVNFDMALRRSAKLMGVEPELLTSEEEVQAIRQQRAQQQALLQQQQQEAMQLEAAKTASDIELNKNSALDKMLEEQQVA